MSRLHVLAISGPVLVDQPLGRRHPSADHELGGDPADGLEGGAVHARIESDLVGQRPAHEPGGNRSAPS